MNVLLNLAAKDLRLMSRDTMGMFFIVGMPVLMGVLFGLIGVSMSGGGSGPIRLAVCDEDGSAASAQFVQNLRDGGSVDLSTDLAREAALRSVRRGRFAGVIIVPAGFGRTAGMFWEEGPALEVGVDPTRRAEAGMIEGLIMQAMGELTFARFRDPAALRPLLDQSRERMLSDEAMPPAVRAILGGFLGDLDRFMGALEEVDADDAATTQAGEAEVLADAPADRGPAMQFARIERIDVTASPTGNETLDRLVQRPGASAWDLSFPSAMLWGALACAAGFAVTLVRERTQGTLLRLQLSPVSRAQIVAGKGLACLLAVLAVNVFMLVLGLLLGLRPGNYALLVLAMVCVAFCFVGIMMLMAVLGTSEEAVGGAAWGANVVMAMFGGGMIPLLFMPAFLQTLSNLSPVKWGILALEGAIWRGSTLAEMLPICGVLLAIGAAGLLIGTAIFNRRLSRA
ncbi:MAG: ABC transporter permease [Phycisphaerales bacterium]|nr:ABC transporter permease [Phycisphaerales bacterium]